MSSHSLYRSLAFTFGLFIVTLAAAESSAQPLEGFIEGDPFGRPRPATATEPAGRKAPGNRQEKPDDPATPISEPEVDLPPTYIRLHLADGDIVSGELENNSIAISTEFGTLSVPIEKIIKFEPGLNSYPEVMTRIKELVEELGSAKYEVRQKAHKSLVSMGPRIQNEIKKFNDGGNAERKRHLEEIRKEIDKTIEELDDEDLEESENQPWDLNDKLVMANFTAVGKIQQNDFKLRGKYGDLSIRLSEISKGTRPSSGRDAVQKSLTVNKDNFVQLQWKSAGIVLEKGDQVSVTAKGTISLTPWGSNAVSTPKGTPQYGVMPNTPGIPFGALVAKIGNGKYFLVGDKKTFRADSKGKLQFGITMRSNYVGKNYQYPGDYKLKVKVEPGSSN